MYRLLESGGFSCFRLCWFSGNGLFLGDSMFPRLSQVLSGAYRFVTFSATKSYGVSLSQGSNRFEDEQL